MRAKLFPFQQKAVDKLSASLSSAAREYADSGMPQIISLQAPTGAGKTIIMSALVEKAMADNPNAVFVWLSDSPELNEQSRKKMEDRADGIPLASFVTISDNSLDREELESGKIYFLNTQKIGKAGNLVRHSDMRQFTIWETLANTARNSGKSLAVIIDEAHRGMRANKDAAEAVSIMQKFLKGSPADGLPPMPVTLGMSATSARFERLAGGIADSTLRKVAVTPEDVRDSGLLKDKIILIYPDDKTHGNEMTLLDAAVDDWKEKCRRWKRYCAEGHYQQFNPILLIQARPKSGDRVSATDLDEVMRRIMERTGEKFMDGEAVHTFGDVGTLTLNGARADRVAPSEISGSDHIKIVFFKENLSTGWDCPRAETMMSFSAAEDPTYIAQLLGRMVRTPFQRRVEFDETLNNVHLYLPYFNQDNVRKVAEALQSSEGGEIPVDSEGERYGKSRWKTLTADTPLEYGNPAAGEAGAPDPGTGAGPGEGRKSAQTDLPLFSKGASAAGPGRADGDRVPGAGGDTESQAGAEPADAGSVSAKKPVRGERVRRGDLIDYINGKGLLSYDVRSRKVSDDYLKSLLALASALTRSGIDASASESLKAEIARIIHNHIEKLKRTGEYEGLKKKSLQLSLSAAVFDAFGKEIARNDQVSLFPIYEYDYQLRQANRKLGDCGMDNIYGRLYQEEGDPNGYKADIIIYASSDANIADLQKHASDRFYKLAEKYRIAMARAEEGFQKEYNDVVSDFSEVSRHNLHLPKTVQMAEEPDGKEYSSHLYADESGLAKISLNSWEEETIAEEIRRGDFVAWLRNKERKKWALRIPYEMNGETKQMYPDFIVLRKDPEGGDNFVIDILEPHWGEQDDNLPKARALARYAADNASIVDRIELIRKVKGRLARLNLANVQLRGKVLKMTSREQLNDLFEETAQG